MSIILDAFDKSHINDYSPLVLAYIGDAVFELIVRTLVLSFGNAPVNKLHRKSSQIVKAKSQAEMYFKIENMLSDEEMSILKKGRNAKSFTSPKNADISDYRHATGVEALFGYLYLHDRLDRAIELFKAGIADENKGE
ncbi:MAG: ribonuclease III [Clostridia bacterium]|jgi:ribonuclease-3 family protein|nr:ribonuclease III [Clostridia bacterium]MCI2000012.1 ribonuclease III [Clostridia bacterium]MCI2014454.1 ribonuclease III [Clostridia bacterium]